jgi:putative membrane protein
MTPLGVLAVVSALWLWLGYGFSGGWLHAKTTLVALLVAYHWHCGRILKTFRPAAMPSRMSGSVFITKCRCW